MPDRFLNALHRLTHYHPQILNQILVNIIQQYIRRIHDDQIELSQKIKKDLTLTLDNLSVWCSTLI